MVRGFRGLRGGRGGRWGGGEGAAHGQRDQQNHGGDRQNGVPGPLHQQLDPLPDGPGGAGHGGGGEEQLAEGGGAGQTDEGPSVIAPLALAKTGQRALVTGQLRIGPADLGGEPDQGIVPVEHETQAPKHGPDVVAVAVVGQLVLQHMGPDLGALGRVGGQVDGRPEKAEDTGGGHRLGHIDGKEAGGYLQRPTPLPELTGQMGIAGDDDCGHQCHSHEPEAEKHPLQIQLDGLPGNCCGPLFCHNGVQWFALGFIEADRFVIACSILPLILLLVGGDIDLLDGSGDLQLFRHRVRAYGTDKEKKRNQKPHQHHGPQRILQPQTDFSPEDKSNRQYGGDHQGGGDDPAFDHGLIDHGSAPPRPCG